MFCTALQIEENMFGRKKTNKLIEDIDRYFDLVERSVSIFKDGVRNYLYSDRAEFDSNLQNMTMLESEVEVLRREIENALYLQELDKLTEEDIEKFEDDGTIPSSLLKIVQLDSDMYFKFIKLPHMSPTTGGYIFDDLVIKDKSELEFETNIMYSE